jgi:lipid II:glycine glycyltransferase (peptidoglycan interpeptide bridge formation enzyme)
MHYVSINELLKFKQNLGHNLSLYVALKNNEMQGCTVIVWSKGHSAYYLYGGSIPTPYSGSMNLLHWQTMKDMKNEGVRYYDFVGARLEPVSGSKLETIQRFKSKFGGTMKKGYLWKFPLKCWKYRLFKRTMLAYAMIRRLDYRGDVIDQEIGTATIS